MRKYNAFCCHQMISVVASDFEISVEDIFLQKSAIARKARLCVVYVARRMTGASLAMIGETLGFDSVSEVFYALRLQELRMKQNPEERKLLEELSQKIAGARWYIKPDILKADGEAECKLVKSSWMDSDCFV